MDGNDRNEPRADVTLLLEQIRGGNEQARARLLNVVYDELRGAAAGLFVHERGNHTLQPTALVHEAWMRLAGHFDSIESRRHFFVIASRAMRRVLIDHARAARREKRGNGQRTISLGGPDDWQDAATDSGQQSLAMHLDLIDLDQKLTELGEANERLLRITEMRLLGTMTVQEIADELQMPKRSVEREWTFALAWLRSRFSG